MSSMNRNVEEAELDQLFERTLLESARGDELPRAATKAAWGRFAGAVAVATLSARANGAGGAFVSKVGTRVAAKWLVIGALGGSSLTFAWMRQKQVATSSESPHDVNTEVTTARPPLPEVPSVVVATPSVSAAPVDEPPATPNRSRREPRRPGALRKAQVSPNAAGKVDAATRTSTLAAEVAALDAARTASSMGNYDGALGLIADYHRDFPAGELSADAAVVAIDALAAKGDEAGAARRAIEFLERYPNDLHAAHVKRVAERMVYGP